MAPYRLQEAAARAQVSSDVFHYKDGTEARFVSG